MPLYMDTLAKHKQKNKRNPYTGGFVKVFESHLQETILIIKKDKDKDVHHDDDSSLPTCRGGR